MFQPKYSADQKAAIVAATVDRAVSCPAAIRQAASGELPEQKRGELEPFEMPLSTARTYTREERDRRAEAGEARAGLDRVSVDVAAASLRKRLVRVLDQETEKVERKRRGDPARVAGVEKIARAMRAVVAVAETQDTGKGKAAPAKPGRKTLDPDAGELEREAAARAATLTPTPKEGAAQNGVTPTSTDPGLQDGAGNEGDGGLGAGGGGPDMGTEPDSRAISGQGASSALRT